MGLSLGGGRREQVNHWEGSRTCSAGKNWRGRGMGGKSAGGGGRIVDTQTISEELLDRRSALLWGR